MKAILFSASGILSDFSVRMNVQRIPEVRIRLNEAQQFLDSSIFNGVDIFSYLSSDDRQFQRDAEFQRLIESLVQLGLYERYIKRGGVGDFFVGSSHSDSVLSLVSGGRTIADHITQSQWALRSGKQQAVVAAQPGATQILPGQPAPVAQDLPGIPLLARGVAQTPLKVIRVELTEQGRVSHPIGEESFEIETLIQNLVDEEKVERVITVGPRNNFRSRIEATIVRERIEMIDVIDSDPFLGWFEKDCQILAAI